MKRIAPLLLLLTIVSLARAQTTTGTITASGCLQINVYGKGTVGIVAKNSGTAWSGTIQGQVIVEADPNGTTGNVQVTPYSSSTAQATITANGSYTASVPGATYFQVCGNTVTNTAAISLTPVALAANRNAGSGLPVGLTYVAPTLTVSSAGNGNGALGLSGNTSGVATFTAPPVAGTSTNPVVSSNVLQGPAGSATNPTYSFSTHSNFGMWDNGGNLQFTENGTNVFYLSGGGTVTFNTDNNNDIGAAGATRPRTGYFGTSVNAPEHDTSGLFGSLQQNLSTPCETAGAPTTLSTGGTTTNTGLNCLPANAIIDALVYRITTTITTATNFTIGDATIAARFCATQSVLTSGTTGICFAQADQTGTSGPRQTAAAAVRITTTGTPGAGAIRLIAYYHTWTAPTS